MREVPDCPGLFVTTEGLVFSNQPWGYGRAKKKPEWVPFRELKLSLRSLKRPYLAVSYRGLTKNVHALIARAFLGIRPKDLQVRHLDGNALNNSLGNLSYGTAKQNQRDRTVHGTDNRGERHPMAILNKKDVREIRKRYSSGGVTQEALGAEYGVGQTTISRAIRMDAWV